MGLGPHPVARARRGVGESTAAPPRGPGGVLGSGLVGVRGTAVRPRTYGPTPGGDERALYVWGW
eukprot:gene21681-biopygen10194